MGCMLLISRFCVTCQSVDAIVICNSAFTADWSEVTADNNHLVVTLLPAGPNLSVTIPPGKCPFDYLAKAVTRQLAQYGYGITCK